MKTLSRSREPSQAETEILKQGVGDTAAMTGLRSLSMFAPLGNITFSDNFLHFLVNLFMDPRGIMMILC